MAPTGPPHALPSYPAPGPRPLTRRQQVLKHLPLLLAGAAFAALLALLALLACLLVFGQVLGLNVSSLDADGPQRPFAAAWLLVVACLGSLHLATVWTPLTAARLARQDGRTGR